MYSSADTHFSRFLSNKRMLLLLLLLLLLLHT
jgi:hypothetical protein